MKQLDVPIPARMWHLERDRRGYPVPANVWRDGEGRPHFTINDDRFAHRAVTEKLCPICGGGLEPPMWFAGGPLSAFHPHGCYTDQPMHWDCVNYAMRTCPYLATQKYSRRIDARTVDMEKNPAFIAVDPTMLPDRPKVFVLVKATGYIATLKPPFYYLKPNPPYLEVQFWQDSERISYKQACIAEPMLVGLTSIWKGGKCLEGLT